METQELHRGRLIDHIQLVVQDFSASQAFYAAVIASLNVPMGGTGDGFFWADELFVTSVDSPAVLGALTGRHHLAFQAIERWSTAFTRPRLRMAARIRNGAPGERAYHPATTLLSS